jgi:EAL domain-containing protein (putative c-di-GMP-specific phosphodiesterase class I)
MASSDAASALLETVPIETDEHVLRARRTAAATRTLMGAIGSILVMEQPQLAPRPALALVGFATILLSAAVQLAAPRVSWLSIEESVSGAAAVLIVGFGSERVSILSILWLVAIASGVLARGGRVHWLGRYLVLGGLLLPVARYGHLSDEYAALCVGTLGLLLTSGRLTRELNHLLSQARLQANSAETLLLAGDIAARITDQGERSAADAPERSLQRHAPSDAPQEAIRRTALARLIAGEGVTMAVQPIVELRSGALHAYEALARFPEPLADGSPLHWFSLADELGLRAELERTCLGLALELFARRPPGTSLSVNLSAPVLLDPLTLEMLALSGKRGASDDLDGLIVEITEETLVHGDAQLRAAFESLRARGACLAVDDMGAGYSGLRQITAICPRYLKLDRSLVSGIDEDRERAALIGALVGYSKQVGSLLVAEGVETAEELQALKRLGVPLVQGFYLGRPGKPWPSVSAPGAARGGDAATELAEMAIAAGRIGALHPVA